MKTPRRDNRRFQAGSMFGRQGGTYVCRCCKRNTRETGEGESDTQLCAYCFLESGIENALSDGAMSQEEFDKDIDELQKQYKRGKYAPVSGPTEAEIKEGVDKLVKELKANAPAINKVLKQVGTQSKPEAEAKVSVKLGYGIVEVLQLDDASNVKDYGLEIDFSKKSFITVTGTRSALGYFADCCQNRISSQFDQPLWYMSSADATVKKINAALEAK